MNEMKTTKRSFSFKDFEQAFTQKNSSKSATTIKQQLILPQTTSTISKNNVISKNSDFISTVNVSNYQQAKQQIKQQPMGAEELNLALFVNDYSLKNSPSTTQEIPKTSEEASSYSNSSSSQDMIPMSQSLEKNSQSTIDSLQLDDKINCEKLHENSQELCNSVSSTAHLEQQTQLPMSRRLPSFLAMFNELMNDKTEIKNSSQNKRKKTFSNSDSIMGGMDDSLALIENENKKRKKTSAQIGIESEFFSQPLIKDYEAFQHEKQSHIETFKKKMLVDTNIIKTVLRPHQVEAFNWLMSIEYLHDLDNKKYDKCALLADEMGLGKTASTLALIASHPKHRHDPEKVKHVLKSTLVVCPTTLIDEWSREIDKHCYPKTLKYRKIQGPTEMRRLKKIIYSDFVEECDKYDILITNFETLRNQIDLLRSIKFLRIVIDEAHFIRNQKTFNFQTLDSLNALYYVCMTGSPISNNMSDLHALFCLMKSSVFSNTYVWKSFIEGKCFA